MWIAGKSARYFTAFLAVGTTAVFVSLGAARPMRPVTQPDPAQQRVEAARRVVEALDQREAGGEAITPTWFEVRATWELRLLEARLSAASDIAMRRAAIEDHLARCRKRLHWAESILDGNTRIPRDMAAYYLADAEMRLAQLDAR